jgi:hypothetical protein
MGQPVRFGDLAERLPGKTTSTSGQVCKYTAFKQELGQIYRAVNPACINPKQCRTELLSTSSREHAAVTRMETRR